MSLLDKLRTRKRAKTDGAFETYRKLVAQAAKHGALADRDEGKLEEAADALGFSLERIEADIAVLSEIERLKLLADGVEEARKASDAAKENLRQAQIAAELAAKSAAAAAQQAEGNRNARLQRWRTCNDARERLQALQRQHHRLLGLPAPTVDPARSPADGEPIDAGYTDAMSIDPAPIAGKPDEARQAQIAERTEIELAAQRDRSAQRQALQAELPATLRTISNIQADEPID
jgi:hypothetical protein